MESTVVESKLFKKFVKLTPCSAVKIQPGIKLASSSTVLLSDLLSVFFPSFFFLYHTSEFCVV